MDAVSHFAAYSLVGESVTNPLKYYDNNLCGTKVLLDAMVKNNVDKIVFSSTAATYGEPENIPILETDRTCPTNPYGETKLAMEKMFKWTAKAHGMKFVSLRYFNACGADASGSIGEAHNPESHLIPLILQVPNGKRESVCILRHITVRDCRKMRRCTVKGNNNITVFVFLCCADDFKQYAVILQFTGMAQREILAETECVTVFIRELPDGRIEVGDVSRCQNRN